MKVLFTIFSLAIASFASANNSAGADTGLSGLPIRFISSVPGDEVFEALKQNSNLDSLSKELPGAPITLRVTLEHKVTSGGGAATGFSAMLAGGSLGLLPIVTNKDLILRYEIFVNGNVIEDFSYLENFTEAKMIFGDHSNNTLDKDVLTWALSTVDLFTAKLNESQNFSDLNKDYQFYFSDLIDQ